MITTLPLGRRIQTYDRMKQWKAAYKDAAYAILGQKCARCGSVDDLRLRFVDPDDLLSSKYITNPVTLHRRICREPELWQRVHLLCRVCRLERRTSVEKSCGPTNQ